MVGTPISDHKMRETSGKNDDDVLSFIFFSFFFYQVYQFGAVTGHGRLMEPPARNSMWRFGYPNPVDYNDNELFCGGYAGTDTAKP